jgi:hypothetical protein
MSSYYNLVALATLGMKLIDGLARKFPRCGGGVFLADETMTTMPTTVSKFNPLILGEKIVQSLRVSRFRRLCIRPPQPALGEAFSLKLQRCGAERFYFPQPGNNLVPTRNALGRQT